jgi:60 kDa SS-A/Ro ribonucleoprotein
MATAREEANSYAVGFHAAPGTSYRYLGQRDTSTVLVELPISAKMRLDDVVRVLQNQNFGQTDCSLPMLGAMQLGLEVDAFCVYTDNETYAGTVHPHEALKQYRQKSGRNAKLAVVGMTSTGFTIADPSDAGMMDFVGFDTSAPAVLADFVRG